VKDASRPLERPIADVHLLTNVPPESSAEQRARALLAETNLFDELGIGQFAASSRVVARDVLELTEHLAAERSARRAVQEARDRLQEIVGKAAYQACVAESARRA